MTNSHFSISVIHSKNVNLAFVEGEKKVDLVLNCAYINLPIEIFSSSSFFYVHMSNILTISLALSPNESLGNRKSQFYPRRFVQEYYPFDARQ